MPEETPDSISDILPLPFGTIYRNKEDRFEYYLIWEADGCMNTHEHGPLFKVLCDEEGAIFVVNSEQFDLDFELIPLNEHPQHSLF